MVLTNKQREKLVLDLYNEGKTIKEIAKEAKMSFRDIGVILKEAGKQEEQTEMQSISSKAYNLFSEGKTALQVAIALNLNDHEVTRLYREYWNLVGLNRLNEVYQELKGNIWPFVNLHRSVKDAGMSVQHVVRLLSIAANDLPSVEDRYELLKREAGKLEEDKSSSAMIIQSLSNQISSMRNTLDSICMEHQKVKTHLCHLYQRSFKQEALVRQFQNDNEEYLKIKKAAEEKVTDVLSARKTFLHLALFSLTDSMRNDPDKYRSLIDYNDDNTYYYHSHDSFIEAYKAMLIEEAEKLYTSMAKRIVDEVIDEYVSKTSASSSRLENMQ
jgi:hypothetical protein